MSTKDRILSEALILFAEKGYSAVFVNDIADAVGIKAPSLYKHYKGKQDIFDSCVQKFYERMTEVKSDLQLPDSPSSELSYETATTEMIVSFAEGLFKFYLRDEVAAGFRKMLMIERFQNPELNRIYEDLFIHGAVAHEEGIFKELIKKGVLKNEDPHILALRFYTPIYYLLQKYDAHPDKDEEALEELRSIVKEFCETYSN